MMSFKSILWRIKYWLEEVSLGIRNVFRKNSARKIKNVCLFLLAVLFVVAIFYHHLGQFVVTVDPQLQKKGVYLSTSDTFENPRTKLFSSALEECNNINIVEIPLDIDNYEGTHNGDNYIAYTFYIRNEGKEDIDYQYKLLVGDSTKGVENAAWIMLFKNGSHEVFAKARQDGTAERQYSYADYPIMQFSNDIGKQVYDLSKENRGLLSEEDINRLGIIDIDGLKELRTIPFISDGKITEGIVEGMKPKQYDKYTVVVWLEGEDPDCIDEIKGGYLELTMRFDIIEEEKTEKTKETKNKEK